jgi:hypothetical protein
MSLATALFALAILVTATVAVPVAVAIMVQRQTSAALWLRKHVRWLWAITSLFWLASLALKLAHGSRFAQLDVITSALGFLCTAGIAMLHRPVGADANTLV